MVFCFLGTDDADEVGVGYFATGWDLGLVNEEDGAGAFDALGKRAIFAEAVRKEAAPFVGEAAGPDGLFGAVDELFDGALLAGDWRGGGESGDVVCILGSGGSLG